MVKKSARRLPRLTVAEWSALKAVANGADVFDYYIGRALRSVQRKHPELIDIGEPAGRYSAIERNPYFGAITTEAGNRALSEKAEA